VVLLFSVCILTNGLSVLLSPTQVVTGHFCIFENSLFFYVLLISVTSPVRLMPFLKIKAERSSEMLVPHAVLHCITCAEIILVQTAVRTSNLTKQNHVVETADAICIFIFMSLYNHHPVYAWLNTLM